MFYIVYSASAARATRARRAVAQRRALESQLRQKNFENKVDNWFYGPPKLKKLV